MFPFQFSESFEITGLQRTNFALPEVERVGINAFFSAEVGDFVLALLRLLQNPDDLLIGHLSCFQHTSFLRRGASPLFQRQNVRMKMVLT